MKILIGGAALVQLGSSRSTLDTDYLVNDTTSSAPFMKDEANNVDYINANGHPFFAEIFKIEEGNEVASPQSLLELKAFSLVQHCLNGHFQKADDAEYDMKFLCRTFGLTGTTIVNKYLKAGELTEVSKVIASVKK